MSLSTMRLQAQVWPTWLPKAVASVTQHELVPSLQRSISQTPLPPMVFSATFQSAFPPCYAQCTQSATYTSSFIPRFRSRALQQRTFSTSRAQRAAYLLNKSGSCKGCKECSRGFTTSPTSPPPSSTPSPPLAATWHAPPLPLLRPVTILGSGVLGRRLAVIWASTGRPVTLYDTSPSALLSSQTFIADTLSEYCSQQGTLPGKVHFTTSFHDACSPTKTDGAPWLVIEAVPEDLELKVSVLGRVDRTVPRDCIIATNSASFRSRELVSEVQHRERVLNTLYYIPPANRCVELMSCGYTAPNLFPFLVEQMKEVGLNPMKVGNESTGMIFPRLFGAMKRETLKILQEQVASPEEVDELFKDFFGAKRGVAEMMDRVGLDTVARTEEHFLSSGVEPSHEGWEEMGHGLSTDYLEWLMNEYVNKGKLGEKSGEGLVVGKNAEGKEKGNQKRKGIEFTSQEEQERVARETWKEHAVDLSGL